MTVLFFAIAVAILLAITMALAQGMPRRNEHVPSPDEIIFDAAVRSQSLLQQQEARDRLAVAAAKRKADEVRAEVRQQIRRIS